jgi:glyoxylase-like metal-dependent hydrolase (beta-lactamase superfamily II)
MRVHHLNCATMCPVSAKLVNGRGGLLDEARMVCHCLLIETDDGLVLVDTGLGLDDISRGADRLGTGFLLATRALLDERETALRQVERLGFKREDVRHIIPTHLDVDHAGGLPDFPDAAVHIFDLEHAAALYPRTLRERERYIQAQWAHKPRWDVLSITGDTWLGFDCVRALGRVGPDVLLVPLLGHTRGHCGVAVKSDAGWLLHGGDAFFSSFEMQEPPRCPPALDLFQRVVAMDNATRLVNQARLRELAQGHASGGGVDVFCAHCPDSFDRLAAASIVPAKVPALVPTEVGA